MKTPRALILFGCLVLAGATAERLARADISVGSDGSDGSLYVTSNTVIDLSKAATATWDTPSPVAGKGVYDPQKWAVVFKYDSVYVAPGVSVSFLNNSTNAPVVWLARYGVTIDGYLSLDGHDGVSVGTPAVPGPGGFRGGKSGSSQTGALGGAGMGPGGGQYGISAGGGYGTIGYGSGSGMGAGGGTYGSPQVLPLIGGSGGGGLGWSSGEVFGGGGGGGGILIAAGRIAAINGNIHANGGYGTTSINSAGGGGSGGAIRIVADQLLGTGSLYATGSPSSPANPGRGGVGRVRLEANSMNFTGGGDPVFTLHLPIGNVATVWPSPGSPRIAISAVGGVPTPGDPNGNLFGGDLQISSAASVPVTVTAANVPVGAAMAVKAVLVAGGQSVTVSATLTSGDQTASTWTATLPAIPNNGYTLLQAHVTLP